MTGAGLRDPSLSYLKPVLEFIFDEPKVPKHIAKFFPSESGSKYRLYDLGKQAWESGSLETFKLLFSLRAAGKLDDDDFYRTILWVYKHHPLTLTLNLRVFGELRLFTDLLGILHKVLEQSICGLQCPEKRMNYSYGYLKLEREKEERKAEEVVAAWRRSDGISKAKIALEWYRNDRSYQVLHCLVADIFAEFLKSDLKYLESVEAENISSAAKVCPSLDSKYDKETLLCESIAKRIFPREEYEDYRDISEPHYVYRVRDRLRKKVLVPLRHALMSSQLNNAAAKKVKMTPVMVKALKSMKIYRALLYYAGPCKLQQCMKIVGMYHDGLKLPHQIINSLNNSQISDEIAEGQWQRLIRELSNKGKLRNCIAVCDIPESMRGTSYESVCIAMGLLISELGEYQWQGKAFSFGDTPRLHKIKGENLRLKCEFMKQHMESANKLNFGEIYNKMLEIAIKEKLGHHQIPERVFVFTDKDFDMAFTNDWFDDYAKAVYDYKSRGYVFNVPDMVLWNLKGYIAEPKALHSLVKDQDVGMIMTAFSSNLLRLFLNAESDSRCYAPQFKVPYGFGYSFASLLIPRVEDVYKCAVSGNELKNLFVFE